MSLISDVCEKQPLLDFLSPPDEKDTEIILERVLSDLHAGQLSFVNDTETEILGLCAGYGSGKTRSLLAKCLHLSLLNQGFTGIVLEPTQPLVRDLFVTEFEEFLLNYEIPYTFRSSPLPDFVLLAESFGIKGLRVEEYNKLETTIDEMINHQGPVIADIRVAKEENCFPMIPSGAAHNEMILGVEDKKNDTSEAGLALV